MHRLATVHARDNQPTNQRPTNDQRRHDTAYLNKRLFYYRKVRRLKTLQVTQGRSRSFEITPMSRASVSSYKL